MQIPTITGVRRGTVIPLHITISDHQIILTYPQGIPKLRTPFKFKPLEAIRASTDVVLYTEGETNVMDNNVLTLAVYEGSVDYTPLRNQKCMITGEEAIGIQMLNTQLLLRPDIIQMLAMLGLSRKLWQKINQLATGNHFMGSQFYEDGYAKCSKMEFLAEANRYVPLKNRPKAIRITKDISIASAITLG